MAVVAAFLGGIGWQRTYDDRQRTRADHERDLLKWRLKSMEENNAVLNHELRSTMLDLMRAEAKEQVSAERATE
jgi:hypothetical protein